MSTSPESIKEADLPENLKNLWLKAVSAAEIKNYPYAINLLQTVLKEEPCFLDGRKLLRQSEIQHKKGEKKLLKLSIGGLSSMKIQGLIKKDPKAAFEPIEKLLENDPFQIPANQLLYDAAKAAGMLETATFALETLRQGHPENTKILHQLAQHYLEHDDPSEAAQVYNEIVKVNSSDLEAIKGAKDATARASIQKQNWEGAGSFRDLIKDEKEAANLEQKSRAVLTKEQMKEQLEEWGKVYAEDQNNLDATRKIADLYERLEDYEQAISYYEWALQLSNGDPSLERKVSETKKKQREHVITTIEAYIKENPEAADIEEKKEELETLKKDQASILVIEAKKRVEQNPTDPQLRFELGEQLVLMGQHSEAIPELQRAKNNPHLRTKALLMLGQCYEQKNMYDLAVRQLSEASANLTGMDGTKKEILYTQGLVYEKMGEKEKSIECMKQIYETDYEYRDVAKRVEESYT